MSPCVKKKNHKPNQTTKKLRKNNNSKITINCYCHCFNFLRSYKVLSQTYVGGSLPRPSVPTDSASKRSRVCWHGLVLPALGGWSRRILSFGVSLEYTSKTLFQENKDTHCKSWSWGCNSLVEDSKQESLVSLVPQEKCAEGRLCENVCKHCAILFRDSSTFGFW